MSVTNTANVVELVCRSLRVGMLYFDDIKVKEQWIGQQQSMALFERIRPVGKGAYGTAVLYRKKDDDSLVVLKEINIMELSKAERGQAMNEVQRMSRTFSTSRTLLKLGTMDALHKLAIFMPKF